MGLASFPLCFDLYTTLWFNNLAVTTEIPPPDVRLGPAWAKPALRPLVHTLLLRWLSGLITVGVWCTGSGDIL